MQTEHTVDLDENGVHRNYFEHNIDELEHARVIANAVVDNIKVNEVQDHNNQYQRKSHLSMENLSTTNSHK